jgi:hypothetical protein
LFAHGCSSFGYFGSGLSGKSELGAGGLTGWLGGCSTPFLTSIWMVFLSALDTRSALR